MSNNQIKNHGSIANISDTTNSSGIRKSGNDQTDQSGWQNYPENIDDLEELNSDTSNEKPNDLTEEILKQLIAENTQSLVSEQLPEPPQVPVVTDETQEIPQPVITSQPHLQDDFDNLGQEPQQTVSDEHYLEYQLEELSKRSLSAPQPLNDPLPPLPEIMPQDDEQLKVEALERWLDKPMPDKESSHHWAVLGYTAACLGVALLTYTGIYITGNYKNFSGPLVQVGSLLGGSTTNQTAFNTGRTPSLSKSDSGSSSHSKSSTFSGGNSRGNIGRTTSSSGNGSSGNSSSGAGSSGPGGISNTTKAVATAGVIASPGLKEAASACSVPEITLTALPGGFSRISMQSDCHSNENVSLKYAGINFNNNFDQNGKFTFVLDAFAGEAEPVQIEFKNGKQIQKKLTLADMDKISKISVIWDGKEDVNLHAFEYASRENTTGHVWEQNPRSYNNALQKVQALQSGRGFISTASTLSDKKQKRVEVYTFLHSEPEKGGVIKLALTYSGNKSNVNTVSCTNNTEDAPYLSYETTQLLKNAPLKKEQGQILINNCLTTNKTQYITRAVQDLILIGDE